MPIKVIGNTVPAVLIASFRTWTKFHVQVRNANTLYLGTNRGDIENSGPQGLQQGLSLTQGQGIVSLEWTGDLYVLGSAPNTVFDIETFPETIGAAP